MKEAAPATIAAAAAPLVDLPTTQAIPPIATVATDEITIFEAIDFSGFGLSG